MLGLRFLFGILEHIPWFRYIFMLGILMIPAILFISVFGVFYKRTTAHPSRLVRIISRTLLAPAILMWFVVLIADLIRFFSRGYTEIGKYFSYSTILLAACVAFVFLLGVLQALTTEKEKDWLEGT
jgi:hypothetical protein